jgi:hypothetical protein
VIRAHLPFNCIDLTSYPENNLRRESLSMRPMQGRSVEA